MDFEIVKQKSTNGGQPSSLPNMEYKFQNLQNVGSPGRHSLEELNTFNETNISSISGKDSSLVSQGLTPQYFLCLIWTKSFRWYNW